MIAMLPETSAELILLVEDKDGHHSERPRLHLNGRNWTLRLFPNIGNVSDELVDYICVSYIWGPDRTSSPLKMGPQNISTNTLPALSAAMQNTSDKAFWIDAFSVPTVQPAKAATLESMGFIYSQAKEVRAVLSESSFLAVKQLSTGDSLDCEALITVEADKWIQSVWTYQEVVNSQRLAFLCSAAPRSIVDGSHFLNGIGYSISRYKKKYDIDSFTFRASFPSLDALEDLIADWMIAGYQERSALAVMSNMDRRKWNEERNYYYSMIGAITSKPSGRLDGGQQHLAETLMGICESKGDFSFVYSSSPRSTEPTKRWRPQIGLLPSILPWHSWGESQPGHFDESGFLWLDQMLVYQKSPPSEEAKDYIARWLHRKDSGDVSEDWIGENTYPALKGMGFTGNETFTALTHGIFFAQTSLPTDNTEDLDVFVSATIRWTFGAPGIASYTSQDGVTHFIPGVFAGVIDVKLATSVKLI
ncbi:MAG: hypothetical protein M1820_005726 [Bogoriella megaspora]|nr:MAG: hypothetical protein M1820_005726 [Bogoriella megaspora]